ncbi:MFS transporter, partial [Bradyrhizobium sp.]|uniref:MFS transporter n=1 Tax=Bradyrhizobium sp. TaxID=376 RepID=UPI003C44F933
MAERVLDVAALIETRGIGPAQWRVIGLCAVVAMLDGMDLQSIGLAAPAMSAELHIAPPAFGVVFSAALAGLALGAFLLGPVADRIGRKRVLVGATFCFGVFTLATAAAGNLSELLACRFLTGFGLGGAMPSFISLGSEYVARTRRAAVVSLLWAGFPLGGVAGGLLGSWIIPRHGWPALFLVGGALPVLLSIVLAIALPESVSFLVATGKTRERIARTLHRMFPDLSIAGETRYELASEIAAKTVTKTVTKTVAKTAAKTAAKTSVIELFRSGRAMGTLLLWTSFFFAFMILVTNSSWSPILLRRVGIAPEETALALALYNFGSLFGSAAAGWLLGRFGVLRVLPPTLMLGAMAYAAVGWSAPSLDAVMVAEGRFGVLLGCGSSGLIALAAISYPVAIRSTGVGWATGIGRLGSV